MRTFALLLTFVSLPVFANDMRFYGCLDGLQDNNVKDGKQLKTQLNQALNSTTNFQSVLKTIDRYSACPGHEPGTDVYFVFSKAQTEVNDDELIIHYENVRQLSTKDGKHYTSGPSSKKIDLKYSIFKTDVGMRFGNKESRLVLGEGLFLTEKAAKDRFMLKPETGERK